MEDEKGLEHTEKAVEEPPAYPPMQSPSVNPVSLEAINRYRASIEARQTERLSTSTCMMVFNAVFVILIPILLSQDDSDCDTPVRLWLAVFAITCGVSMVLQLCFELVMCSESLKKNKCVIGFMTMIFVVSFLFNFVWFILGNVWLYGDGECDAAFEGGYIVTLVILICYYIVYALVCCLCCCICCCTCVAGMASQE